MSLEEQILSIIYGILSLTLMKTLRGVSRKSQENLILISGKFSLNF